ncbi:hypothetical protein Tco_1509950 [Tanacetum coccineum]
MEHRFLSSSCTGVKQKKGANNNNDSSNVTRGGNLVNLGNGVDHNMQHNQNINDSGNATHVDQNTQLDHNVGGSTACVFAGQGTNGPSDVQTSLANDVTKGPGLSMNTKGHVSFAKLVTGKPSRKYANFHTLLWPADNGADVVVSLESGRAISEHFSNSVYGFFLGCIAYTVVDY